MLFIDKNQILVHLPCFNIYKIFSITSFYSLIYITEFKKYYKRKIQEFIVFFNVHYLLF